MTLSVAQLTRFDSEKRLTKRISKAADGRITKESASLARGTAQRVEVADAQELAHLLTNLKPTQALSYGVTERLSARVGPRDHLRHGEISRTREHFTWPAGPGVLFLDLDGEYTPYDVSRLAAILADALPEIGDAPQVWQQSSSGGIHDPETGTTRKGGLHCLVMVADAQSIPSLGDRLARGLWLNGHGHHLLSKGENPAALERCLVDTSVWQPERLDYAAPPVLQDGLERVGGHVVAVRNADAAPLDPAAITPLSAAQEAAVSAAKTASKAEAQEGVREARAALLEALPPAEREPQRRRWLAMDRQTLTPDARLILRDGRTITAGDVLDSPASFDGAHCRDPMDPFNDNANDTQARIYADAQGCRVWSLAHGGRLFRIVHEAPQEVREAARDVVALAPEPARGEVIGACYRHGAEAKPDAFEAVADELSTTPEKARATWREHLARRYRDLHHAAPASLVLDDFDAVREHLATGVSTLVKAKLGSGKSQLAAGMARQLLEDGGMMLSATLLSALTRANADAMGSAHYRDDAASLATSRVVSTTMHSLTAPRLSDFIEQLRQHRGKVVIDEAAMTATLLLNGGGIMDDAQRHDTLRALFALRDAGCQFILLDGDVTPPLALLAELLGAEVVECTADPYPAPAVSVLPAQHVREDATTGISNAKSTPRHADILRRLARGERVVIATDSAANAEKLHRMYSEAVTATLPTGPEGENRTAALLLTADNKDLPEQSRYIAAPNVAARDYQLVVHSPVLGAGFSVTSIEPTVYAFITTSELGAPAVWQLVRRFRRARHINVVVSHHLCSPCGQFARHDDIERDLQCHAELLDLPRRSIGTAGMAACEYARALHLSNPLHAIIGHLENIGARYDVIHDDDTSGVQDRQSVRELIEEERTEAARTAPREPLEVARDRCKATPEDAAILRRAEIEEALCIEESDLEDDGVLPYDVAYGALFDDLTPRTQRHGELLARRAGLDLDAVTDVPTLGFSGRKHLNEQADIVLTMVDAIGDELCSDNALEAFEKVRGRIRVAHAHLTRPPRKDASRQKKVGWVRSTLERFGYTFGESAKRHGKRFYPAEPDPLVRRFASRSAPRRFGPDSEKIGSDRGTLENGVSVCCERKIQKGPRGALTPLYRDTTSAPRRAVFFVGAADLEKGPSWVGTWAENAEDGPEEVSA